MAGDKVVVLGGTGFVGRHVCTAFAAAGRDVVVAGRHPPADASPYRFIAMDLERTPASAVAAFLDAERPGVIVNTVGSIWGRTDQQMWAATAVPTLRLLDALALMSARPRLVHLGSVLEYGRVPAGTRLDATTVAHPTSEYGRCKLAAADAVLARAATGDLDAMVLRIANVAGPGTPRVSLLGRVADQLLAVAGGGEVAVIELAPLRAHRDYVDVRDVADAVVAAASAGACAEVVDIGRGEAVPVRYLVELLIEASGIPARIVEQLRHTGPSPAPDWLQVDIRRARELLGWQPLRSLEEAVRAFWNDIAPATTASTHPGE